MRNTRIEVNLTRLENNYRHLRQIHAQGRIMTVIKADAYGHGLLPIARFLQTLGQDLFGVALVEEALALRTGGVTGRILVLGPPPQGSREVYAAHGIEMTVPSLPHLALAMGQPGDPEISAHLKLDTGMGRIGFQEPHLAELLSRLKHQGRLRILGLFSHLAESETLSSDFSEQQRTRFNTWLMRLRELPALTQAQAHLANSAALLRNPDFHYDFARVGHGLWAPLDFEPAERAPEANAHLLPVMRLICPVTHVKTLSEGDSVGYSRTYRGQAGEVIATLPIGYGDGFPRALSNQGRVSLRGVPFPIVGNVSMDQTTFSLGRDPRVSIQVGDEVVLLGDPPQEPGLSEVARTAGTISYQIMTGLNHRIPRIYLYQGREIPEP